MAYDQDLSEQIQKRLQNREDILRTLHCKGACSRTDLALCCRIRKSSITGIVAELLDEGVVCECEPGRKRSSLKLNSDGIYVVACLIDEGGIDVFRVTLGGNVSAIVHRSINAADPQEVLHAVAATYRRHGKSGCLGLSIALPGIIDVELGSVKYSARLGGWDGFQAVKQFSGKIGCRVWLGNDVYSQMLACNWFENDSDPHGSILYVSIDRGIACRLTIDGRAMRGDGGEAGEIGHIRCGDSGRVCSCGKVDCMECYCSIPALIRTVNEFIPDCDMAESPEALWGLARKDRRVRNVIERELQRLVKTLLPVVFAVSPGRILVATADNELSAMFVDILQNLFVGEIGGVFGSGLKIHVAPPVILGIARGAVVQPVQELFCGKIRL